MCNKLPCLLFIDSNIPSGSSSPTQPRDPSLATIKSLLTSINPDNASKDLKEIAQITQNSLFDEGLRIAQQFGLADFAEEIQQLKGDNSTEDLSTSKNSNDNSLNQSTDKIIRGFQIKQHYQNQRLGAGKFQRGCACEWKLIRAEF